jgi:hypothetical protein
VSRSKEEKTTKHKQNIKTRKLVMIIIIIIIVIIIKSTINH